ncbi:formyltetrahydrofolate deformylase [Flaviflexus salsibiostraticola]|uniref:Formyltetrahydrofolate deformylase n=1 Tax=Flaviflexus salsibiostraticola TaxID=1282737 RepID=A0A3S8Z8H1_9ACTO|nr:formyltetrahydrofolate deformylase [Flaviflexus salsibiostraticola]AZN29665.1 formyltetrahydrofolate deformylase [Flaviflexus salsibiostraticola]
MPSIVLSLSCPDRPGIVHSVTGLLVDHGGNITESQQYGDPDTGRFFLRIEADIPGSIDELRVPVDELAATLEGTIDLTESGRPIKTIIMASTTSHCLTDLLYLQRMGRLAIDVTRVVSNHDTLRPIAEFYGVPYTHIPFSKDRRDEAEAELLQIVEETGAELIVLARYMQVLSPELCERMAGSIINIHHSFLPSFKGARPYQQAHDRGVKIIGATAHYVTQDLDEGQIIEQDVERVTHGHTAADLQAIGEDVERRVLARAVQWHAEGRVLRNGERTVVLP